MRAEKFTDQGLNAVVERAEKCGVRLPLSENIDVLRVPLEVAGRRLANRLAVQPMEGCDGTPDGAPGELTARRYRRFAGGGAGLIWFEAVAVSPEARANPRQLMLTEQNLGAFQALAAEIKETAQREQGLEPVLILQATHSGRYSKPEGKPAPVVMGHCPPLEKNSSPGVFHILSDDELQRLEERYAKTAALAQKAGFDGVDIKACHRYLISESLSAYERPGPYGGSLENRTRLYRNAVAAARSVASGGFLVTSRLNVYDGLAYPWGFGVRPGGGEAPDLAEPVELVRHLYEEGMRLLDITRISTVPLTRGPMRCRRIQLWALPACAAVFRQSSVRRPKWRWWPPACLICGNFPPTRPRDWLKAVPRIWRALDEWRLPTRISRPIFSGKGASNRKNAAWRAVSAPSLCGRGPRPDV